MLQYDDSAFYFVALSFITLYIVPCKFGVYIYSILANIYFALVAVYYFDSVLLVHVTHTKLFLYHLLTHKLPFYPSPSLSLSHHHQHSMVYNYQKGKRCIILQRRRHWCNLTYVRRERKSRRPKKE